MNKRTCTSRGGPAFEAWWHSGVHGWDVAQHGAEYTLARDAWEAGQDWLVTQMDEDD